MSKSPKRTNKLRLAAEARLEEIAASRETNGNALDQTKLIHELQVHQIEMEMQGESLKQAHAALETSHNRYLDLYELSPVGYLTLTPTGEIAEINMTGAQLFGLDRSGLLKRDFSAFVSREDSERWRQFFQSLVRQGGDGKAEFRLVRNDLNLIDLRLDCLAVRREPEEFVIHVAMTDITARKDAEKRLRDQEHLFRVIAERLDGFVAVLDAKGQRIYNSPSYERLLGPRDSIGTNSFLEIHPDDRQRVMQAFSETVASGIGQLLEYRFLLPDGSVRIMESRGGVAWDAVGKTQYVVVISNDVTERKEAERKIHRLAFYDALTKLPNRLTLNDRLQQAMAASKRSGQYGALMFIDLDNFKSLNDAHGHVVGDQLLVQAGQRISDCVREIDTVARFGGDEFVVVLGELDVDLGKSVIDAGIIAEKIRATIAQAYVLEKTSKDAASQTVNHRCTASIGVILFMNHDQSEEEVLKLADIAMYRAKDRGRDGIYFYGVDS